MIRFNCPNCDRSYELPDAMHRLPLLCKGCGQHFTVPEPSAERAPTTNVGPPNKEPTPKKPEPTAAPNFAGSIPPRESRTETKPDFSLTVTPPVLAPMPPSSSEDPDEVLLRQKLQAPSLAIEESGESTGRPKSLVIVVDALSVVLLIVIGAFVGEMLARQPTGELLRDAATAPKFPPVELILWLAPTAMLCLIYWMLASRHKSLGFWMQRWREMRM